MARTPAQRLAAYDDRYRALAAQLADIGPITTGSLTRRYTRCASPGCKCNANPPRPHGPYWQLTRKIDGKTVTRRLTPAQAGLYRQWIANDRRLHHTINQMHDIAAKANEIRLTHPDAEV